jgi:fumarate hydratase class II
MLKSEAAAVNAEMGVISAAVAAAIRQAAAEILDGEMADQFPVDIDRMFSYALSSPAIVTALATRIGYDAAAKLAAEAAHADLPMMEFLASRGEYLDLVTMSRPHPEAET